MKDSTGLQPGLEGDWEIRIGELVDALAAVIDHPCTPPHLSRAMSTWLPSIRENFLDMKSSATVAAMYARSCGRTILQAAAQEEEWPADSIKNPTIPF